MHNIERYHFKGQESGEIILKMIRRHWFNIFVQFLPIIGILFMMLLSLNLIPYLFVEFVDQNATIFYFFESLCLLFVWMYASLVWVDYYLDVWIITNKRVVNIEQKGLFLRHVSELRFEKIQDVTTEVKGIIPTFLDYGDVFIQTAAEKERFLFQSVPRPYHIKEQLMDLQKRAKRKDLGELENMLRGGAR